VKRVGIYGRGEGGLKREVMKRREMMDGRMDGCCERGIDGWEKGKEMINECILFGNGG
jgi:hypothetical protein